MRNDVNKSIKSDWSEFENLLNRFQGWIEHNRDQLWSLKDTISEEDWNNVDELDTLRFARAQAADDIRWMLEGLENCLEQIEMSDDDISARIDQLEAEELER